MYSWFTCYHERNVRDGMPHHSDRISRWRYLRFKESWDFMEVYVMARTQTVFIFNENLFNDTMYIYVVVHAHASSINFFLYNRFTCQFVLT